MQIVASRTMHSPPVARRLRTATLLAVLLATGRAHAAGDVELKVIDDKGKPIARAEVRVFERGERNGRSAEWTVVGDLSSARGQVQLPGLDDSKRYRLEVTPPAAREDLALFDQGKWAPKSGEVRLEPGFTIRGRVSDPLKRSLKKVSVYLWAPVQFGDGSFRTAGGRAVEPDGSFRFDHVPRRRAVLRAFRQDEKYDDHDAVVVAVMPEKPTVEIVLARDDESALIRRRVDGVGPGRPAFLLEPAGTEFATLFDLPPEAVFLPVPNVKFDDKGEFVIQPTFENVLGTLWIPSETSDEALCLHVLEVGLTPADRPLKLEPGHTIRGRVRVETPAPPESPEVWALGPGGMRVLGTVAEDRTFRVPGLPKGRWEVEAGYLAPHLARRRGSVEADTGTEVVIDIK